MSWRPAPEPASQAGEKSSPVEMVIVPTSRDLGGFQVRRALPSARRRMVGPFIFLDQMGPVQFQPGTGLDVRPHPHVGLATVTYLFEGEILHRDSLGNVQAIRPGALNWMTAGRGIAHSERSSPETRQAGPRLAGIQSWVALPKAHEETAPSFIHHGSETLPVITGEGKNLRVIVGALFGARSPMQTLCETLYADAILDADSVLPLPADYEERAIYVIDGAIEIAGQAFDAGQLLLFRPGDAVSVKAISRARLLLLGGETMDGPRHIWWNFVSSSRERIEQAKADWKAGRFAAVSGDSELMPLPD
jgi:redox-sensitive bicupin YhaK (pirin superfamily)